MTDSLLYTRNGAIATLTINRPEKRNALAPETISRLLDCLEQAEADDAVRVLILTGAGDRAFCAGADLGAQSADFPSPFDLYARLLTRLAEFPKPTIARINGWCLAGGMGLMLACDVAVAREDARFGTPEVNVGIWPMMIGALILRSIHRKQAYELVMLGEQLDAAAALQRGLITRMVPPEQLDPTVQEIAARLAAKSPLAMRLGKQAFRETADLPFDEAVALLSKRLQEVLASADAQEGMAAFREKREARFIGR